MCACVYEVNPQKHINYISILNSRQASIDNAELTRVLVDLGQQQQHVSRANSLVFACQTIDHDKISSQIRQRNQQNLRNRK